MKVLWTHNFDPSITGSGSFMYTFAKGMMDFGIDIELMYLGQLKTLTQLIRARDRVRRSSVNFDLVHAQFGSACAFVSSASDVPKVVSLRGSDWHFYRGPDPREFWHCLLANMFSRICLSSFHSVVTMSKRMEGSVRRWYPSSRIDTIADPVDISLFKPLDRAFARAKLFATNSKAPWVLFTTLNKSNPIKRVDLAIEAVRIASQRIPGLELKVANGIPHDLMPLFVSSCNLALCTSTHEGWPNALKESLACGLPFVSTDVSDLAQIASRHRSCIVSPPDSVRLADSIVMALNAEADDTLSNEVYGMSMTASCQSLARLYFDLLSL